MLIVITKTSILDKYKYQLRKYKLIICGFRIYIFNDIYIYIMIDVVIQKTHNPKKKYDAIFNSNKTISFGASGYEDYTTHKDDKRRGNYIKRHGSENWGRNNIESAAWLSR